MLGPTKFRVHKNFGSQQNLGPQQNGWGCKCGVEVSGLGVGRWGGERGQRELFQQDIAIFKHIHRVGVLGWV